MIFRSDFFYSFRQFLRNSIKSIYTIGDQFYIMFVARPTVSCLSILGGVHPLFVLN